MKIADASLQGLILYIFAGLTVLLILLVAGLVIWSPTSITGKLYDIDSLGHSIGSEIFYSFDPYISNLPKDERYEAYQSLLSQMESTGDAANQKIRKKIAEVIRKRAGISR
jgi:hypothetical protein